MYLALSKLTSQAGAFPQDSSAYETGGAMFGGAFMMVLLLAVVLTIAGAWKMFAKAGQPGWAAIVPFYNMIVLAQIAGKPAWWFILMIIPFVSFIIWIILSLEIAKRFGRGTGTAIGLILLPPIFICVLGFGDAVYNPEPATNLGRTQV
jgi:hypothetical protein